MKAMIKHLLPLLIVCLLCGAILVSCGPEPAPTPGGNPGTEEPAPTPGGNPGTEEPAPTPGGNPGTEEPAPTPGGNPGTEEPDPAPEQPDDSFSGKDFTKYY